MEKLNMACDNVEVEDDERLPLLTESDILAGIILDNEDSDIETPDHDDFSPPVSLSRLGGEREDEEYCEMSAPPRRASNWDPDGPPLSGDRDGEERIFYPPERAPPLLDFFTLFTAFLVAVFAAYYSISF